MKVILAILFISLSVMAYEVTDKNERNPKQKSIKGFKDTPKQAAPYDQWHVHDPDRPQPDVAAPKYDGKPVPAPQGAKVLFDGNDLDQWKNKKWPLKSNSMIVAGGNQESTEKFQDIHLHVEWKAPEGRKGWGQAQGNSGIYLMGIYEVQILNCWANRTYPDGMTGALYGQRPPKYNACKKPGEWQSFDIHFKAPLFTKMKLNSPAYITVFLNGVKIHDNYAITGGTKYRQVAAYRAHVSKGPIMLQTHGSPVSFRNIWVMPLKIKIGK